MSFSATFGHSWNPESELEILNPGYDYSFTCRGWAPSQDRRCRNPINQANRAKAQSILRRLERMPLDSESLDDELSYLATLCLCVRYHRNQAYEVVREWKGVIRGVRQREGSIRPITTTPQSNTVPVSTTRLPYASLPWTGSGHRNVGIASTPAPQSPFTPFSLPTTRSITTAPPPRALPCNRTHVPRRSIDEECAVCTGSMTHENLQDLVWCKSECGNSVHRSCFERWRRERGPNARCTICRGAWAPECEHDLEEPAFSIWTTPDDIGLSRLFDTGEFDSRLNPLRVILDDVLENATERQRLRLENALRELLGS